MLEFGKKIVKATADCKDSKTEFCSVLSKYGNEYLKNLPKIDGIKSVIEGLTEEQASTLEALEEARSDIRYYQSKVENEKHRVEELKKVCQEIKDFPALEIEGKVTPSCDAIILEKRSKENIERRVQEIIKLKDSKTEGVQDKIDMLEEANKGEPHRLQMVLELCDSFGKALQEVKA